MRHVLKVVSTTERVHRILSLHPHHPVDTTNQQLNTKLPLRIIPSRQNFIVPQLLDLLIFRIHRKRPNLQIVLVWGFIAFTKTLEYFVCDLRVVSQLVYEPPDTVFEGGVPSAYIRRQGTALESDPSVASLKTNAGSFEGTRVRRETAQTARDQLVDGKHQNVEKPRLWRFVWT